MWWTLRGCLHRKLLIVRCRAIGAGPATYPAMSAKDPATIHQPKSAFDHDRRGKIRFPIRREVRYKLLKDGAAVEVGLSETVDIGSGGLSFAADSELPVGASIELSITWPVLLDERCAIRLKAFGRVLRYERGKCACSIDKYEFLTQGRTAMPAPPRRKDNVLPMKPRKMTA